MRRLWSEGPLRVRFAPLLRSWLNTLMDYLQPIAINDYTGQTVKSQDLAGYRYLKSQRPQAQRAAEALAEDLTRRTGQPWRAALRQFQA